MAASNLAQTRKFHPRLSMMRQYPSVEATQGRDGLMSLQEIYMQPGRMQEEFKRDDGHPSPELLRSPKKKSPRQALSPLAKRATDTTQVQTSYMRRTHLVFFPDQGDGQISTLCSLDS